MTGATPTTWTDRVVRAVKSDPKKAGVLAALLVVLAVMWLRLLGGSGGPARASASPAAGRSDSALAATFARSGSRDEAAIKSLREWSRRAVAPLGRNPFVVNLDFFPQDGSKPTLRLPQGDGFWDQLAKSMTARADQKKEREVLVENLRLQAAQLKVQSTVMGASPKALVNGELVGEGDVVASFRVIRIEARRIVVEREGIKLEVRFN